MTDLGSILDSILGLDPQSPGSKRADMLVENDRALLDALIEVRKQRRLTQQDVADELGITQPSVAEFEAHDSNPSLARVRRYAHAVGALVVHKVEADEGQLFDPLRRAEWTSTTLSRAASVRVRLDRSSFSRRKLEVDDASFRSSAMVDNQQADFALAA